MKLEPKMTKERLEKMDSYIAETTEEGCVQLWVVSEGGDKYKEYVVLCDNSVITREEDNKYGEAYFPY